MKKLSLTIACLAISLLLIWKFAPGGKPDAEVSESRAQRIISLTPNLTEIAFELGLDDRIIAVSDHCNAPPETAELPKVGSGLLPDMEKIITLRPDLIISMASDNLKNLARIAADDGCRCVAIKCETIDDIFNAIEVIGRETNTIARADQLRKSLSQRLDQIRRRTETRQYRPRALVIIQREPLIVAGRRTFINSLLEIAGFENAIEDTDIYYPTISSEQLLAANPEYIIEPQLAGSTDTQSKQQAEKFFSRFDWLEAVQKGNIIQIDDEILCRPGPQVARAAEMLERIITDDCESGEEGQSK